LLVAAGQHSWVLSGGIAYEHKAFIDGLQYGARLILVLYCSNKYYFRPTTVTNLLPLRGRFVY